MIYLVNLQIYENVAKRCREKKITIAELERQAGLGNATIAGWKTGYPRIDTIVAVAQVLDCTVGDLISEEMTA